ncbi:MAG: glycosyltransferase family 2 protein [Flavobacteriales bacterium]|nr:glycosyltransferase family 2 protein [Flavobacteriales bacterium]
MRISIITPSYQQAPFLEECIRSVQGQEGAEVEHIVVDGGSTDGSKAVIERHAHGIAWWCSEPDGGQSDALNKGLARATGDVFGWINSDDLLLPGALGRVADAFAARPDLVVYGGQRIIRGDGPDRIHPLDDPADPERLYVAPVINQQSTFYRMDAVRAVGGVDPALDHVMDHDLWLRVLLRFGTGQVRLEPGPLAVFRVHASMKSLTAKSAFRNEMAGVLHGLCVQSGLHALADVFMHGHQWPPGLRPIEVRPRDHDRVRRMALYFLLKWNRHIFDRGQFAMMRHFRDTVPIDPAELDAEQRGWLADIDHQLAVPNWWAFRMRRKWRHHRR